MKAVIRKVSGDLRRRRLQPAVVGLVVLLASGTATLALTLLLGSSNPYDQAFAQQHGAHVLQEFNPGIVTASRLRATAHLPAVAASAGPWQAADALFEPKTVPAGQEKIAAAFGKAKFQLQVVGRNSPAGPVDDLRLPVGRWARRGGEIVITRSFGDANGIGLGTRLVALAGTRRTTFTVVGEAIDVDEEDAANQNPQHAWVLPGQLSALATVDNPLFYEMAYRFHAAGTDQELRRGLSQIASVLPPGALGFTRSYLDVRMNFTITTSLVLTFLLAFSVFALGAAALIVANIVTGTVLASYREIGVMKAIGFTPGQVVQVLLMQMLIPTVAGCLIGIPLGVLLSRPLLERSAHAIGLAAPPAFSPGADLLVLVGVVLVVCVSAGIPAWRAGLLSAVRAITVGTAPEGRRGRWLGRRLEALRLPLSVRYGVVQLSARPLRSGFTAVAILIGVATMTFAFGIRATLEKGLNDPAINGGNYQIEVNRFGGYPDARVMRTLRAQPDTAAVVARDWTTIAVDGLARPVQSVFTRGNPAALGVRAESGRMYAGPNEAVAPAAFLKEAHLQIGDGFSGVINGHREQFHLVGTIFDTSEFGRILHFDFSTLARVMPRERPSDYLVRLRPGADVQTYLVRVTRTAPDYLSLSTHQASASSVIAIIDGVVAVLALVLAVIAVAAVFNTILLNTRERMRDIAILKSLGMGPRQVLVMAASSAAVLGLIGGVLGIPLGVALHAVILQVMANLVGNDISFAQYRIFSPSVLVLLVLAGISVAVAGALLPARWAARDSVVETLHAE